MSARILLASSLPNRCGAIASIAAGTVVVGDAALLAQGREQLAGELIVFESDLHLAAVPLPLDPSSATVAITESDSRAGLIDCAPVDAAAALPSALEARAKPGTRCLPVDAAGDREIFDCEPEGGQQRTPRRPRLRLRRGQATSSPRRHAKKLRCVIPLAGSPI